MERIFINDYGYTHDWIMGKIADDIMREAAKIGYQCRCGSFDDYDGEEICYHLDYLVATPIPYAKHNSVFYTHLNDYLKEKHLVSMRDQFDSFVCMSPEDAEFLIELGFDKNKVFGEILPVRNSYIKPISIGIFSACYPADGRKNESWLLDYCKSCEGAKLVNFVFVGKGWCEVCNKLEELGCTYEWHNVSRKLPYEYIFQQNKLSSLDYYIYMGMDGGAMGTYDAYAQDIPLCVTFDGFHKSIPDLDFSFDNKSSFFKNLDSIISKHSRRLVFFNEHTGDKYCRWLIDVWTGKASNNLNSKDKECISYRTVLEKKQDQYYKITLYKIKSYLYWKFFKIRIKRKYKY